MLKQDKIAVSMGKPSPEHIQFTNSLKVPSNVLAQRINKEIKKNPALKDKKIFRQRK